MPRRIGREIGMPGLAHDDAAVVAPFRDDGVPRAGDGTPEHIESGPEVADARRSKRANAPRKRGHEDASARMSFNTPAAVTAGPAPGPVMINGFVWYRIVVNAT